MFLCDSCHNRVGPRVPCHRIVKQVACRHPFRPKVGMHWEWDEKKARWKLAWHDDKGGPGTKIVSELRVCPECAKQIARADI